MMSRRPSYRDRSLERRIIFRGPGGPINAPVAQLDRALDFESVLDERGKSLKIMVKSFICKKLPLFLI